MPTLRPETLFNENNIHLGQMCIIISYETPNHLHS